MADKINPSGLEKYVRTALPQLCDSACFARMILGYSSAESSVTNIEFRKGYEHAVGVLYNALNLINKDAERVDMARQIEAIRKGMEAYLSGNI
jgi:phospholipid N-methyltransferase